MEQIQATDGENHTLVRDFPSVLLRFLVASFSSLSSALFSSKAAPNANNQKLLAFVDKKM